MKRELPTGTRVGAFVLGLAVLFGGGYGIGQAFGPVDVDSSTVNDAPHGGSHDR